MARPEAARWSAALGAHREAAAHYHRALRYADTADRAVVAGLHEGLAAEYTLLDRRDEAEAALRTGLQHRRVLGNTLRVGEDLSMLSDILRRQRLDEAQRYYHAGMAFCEPRELRAAARSMRGAQADTLLLLGRWNEAADICTELLDIPGVSPSNQLSPLRILGTIRGRRSEPGHAELLDKAIALAARLVSPKRLAQARAVQTELLWISGQPDLARHEAAEAYEQALGQADPWTLGSLAIWLWRVGAGADLPAGLPGPYAREISGDWQGAAA